MRGEVWTRPPWYVINVVEYGLPEDSPTSSSLTWRGVPCGLWLTGKGFSSSGTACAGVTVASATTAAVNTNSARVVLGTFFIELSSLSCLPASVAGHGLGREQHRCHVAAHGSSRPEKAAEPALGRPPGSARPVPSADPSSQARLRARRPVEERVVVAGGESVGHPGLRREAVIAVPIRRDEGAPGGPGRARGDRRAANPVGLDGSPHVGKWADVFRVRRLRAACLLEHLTHL